MLLRKGANIWQPTESLPRFAKVNGGSLGMLSVPLVLQPIPYKNSERHG